MILAMSDEITKTGSNLSAYLRQPLFQQLTKIAKVIDDESIIFILISNQKDTV